jgi:hypothetical protein
MYKQDTETTINQLEHQDVEWNQHLNQEEVKVDDDSATKKIFKSAISATGQPLDLRRREGRVGFRPKSIAMYKQDAPKSTP